MRPLIVVGTGLAGYHLAKEWRKTESSRPLILITQDQGENYSKPMLSTGLSKKKSPEELIMATATEMANSLGAKIITGSSVVQIDAEQQYVILSDGTKLVYENLVLALGADPMRLALPGTGAADILVVNNLDDYRRFRQIISGKKRIGILGGGLIGCEFANDLCLAGYEVAIYEASAWLLSALLPEQAGRCLEEQFKRNAINVHCAAPVQSVEKKADYYQIGLDFTLNDDPHEVDVVVGATGLRPRISLANAAGLTVDRGIVVDQQLRTSNPAIYAVGDCAQVASWGVLPFVMPLMQQVKVLSRTLLGESQSVIYPDMPIVVKTSLCPLVIVPPATFNAAITWSVVQDDQGLLGTGIDEQCCLQAFVLAGSRATDTVYKSRLLRQMRLPYSLLPSVQ